MSRPLPALRKKLLKGFLGIVVILGVSGMSLVMTSVYTATGLTPRALHRNYDSIEAARKMQNAWTALSFPESHPVSVQRETWVRQFDQSLQFELSNVTEPGEAEVARNLDHLWRDWKIHGGNTTMIQEMNRNLEQVTLINERGMFGFVRLAAAVRRDVLIGVALFGLLCLIITVFAADSFATRLANPLKAIAEVLRARPRPGEKLRLPEPTSLELGILVEELQELWSRISKLDQINVERIVRQSSNLETLLSSVEDAVLVFDGTGRVTHVSERMAELLELPPSGLVGGFWEDLSSTSANYFKLRDIIRDRRNNASPVLELKNGDDLRIFAGRFRDSLSPKGVSVSTIFLLHDITESRQQDRLKAEFIGVLSHELKTPIQSLGTAVEILAENKDSFDQRTRLMVETIAEDVARIRAVSNQFMQIGQLSGGVIRIQPTQEALSLLLPEWLKPFGILASDKGIRIEYAKEGSETIYGKIDKVRFPWVVSNLLSNAIRVSPNGSRIAVILTDRNGFTEIQITDEGPGIPEDVQRRMFEPFFQGHVKGSGAAAGLPGFLGLGLTIAKEITEAHGGRIEYYPAVPKGACFRILLPLEGSLS